MKNKNNITLTEKFQNHRNRGKIDTPNTQTHDRTLPSPGTGTSIKSGGVRLDVSAKTLTLRGMMRSCKCFSYLLCPRQRSCDGI